MKSQLDPHEANKAESWRANLDPPEVGIANKRLVERSRTCGEFTPYYNF